MLFTAVIPCYNEEANVPDIYTEILKNEEYFKAHDIELEILYVDDGSKDGTVNEVKKLAANDKRVRLISFSRNFGKEAAIYAGLENSNGDYTALMDADLQDPPSLLPKMFDEIFTGQYDCVATRRVTRKGEPLIRSFFARRFYRIMRRISKTDIVDGARDYRLMCRGMVEAIVSMREYNRFSKGIFGWVGFKTKWIEFENVERRKGETKWSFWGLFKYSLEGIMGFSTAPLAMASVLGIVFTLIAFLAILFIIIRTLIFGDPTNGWPSMACIIIFMGGIQLFCVGILGQYLSKVYLEVKERPIYIVKERI
ncbi:MAG: glycosyltransferase family 2 protein [Lachnospiraceae bacterium]|nr:glycosyltransferase family 2 protein [Lachnospiraceae bacterium]